MTTANDLRTRGLVGTAITDENGNPYSIGPASGASTVTASDSTELVGVRALWVGTGGNVTVTLGGTDVILVNVANGTLLPVMATKVKAATTATDIVALS